MRLGSGFLLSRLNMKIFISWSGNRSRAVAEIISDWIKCVIQASQPWISTRDIDRGAIWFSEINEKLKDTSIGIICLTQDNKNKPWILFETGALAKGLTTNRVCTFLIDLEPSDLRDPLAQFNHTTPNRNSLWELVKTINSCLNEKILDERILTQVFDTYWPKFDNDFKKALMDIPATEVIAPRTEQDLLTEILNNTRGLSKRVNQLESMISNSEIRKQLNIPRIPNEDDFALLNKSIARGASDSELLDIVHNLGLPASFANLEKYKNFINSKRQNENINVASLLGGNMLGGA
jgi:hypothetical protein